MSSLALPSSDALPLPPFTPRHKARLAGWGLSHQAVSPIGLFVSSSPSSPRHSRTREFPQAPAYISLIIAKHKEAMFAPLGTVHSLFRLKSHAYMHLPFILLLTSSRNSFLTTSHDHSSFLFFSSSPQIESEIEIKVKANSRNTSKSEEAFKIN
jgi:hypothetical protein